jgi:hypothetical protein
MQFRPVNTCVAVAIALIALFGAGCVSLIQGNVSENHQSGTAPGTGVIVGSVTAPEVWYHDDAYFYYRSLGDGGKHKGVLTSGTKFPSFSPWLPACDEGGLADQCGRLFAISLPAGSYEIHAARLDRHYFELNQPAVFSVTEGGAIYLGNLHVAYCKGMPGRTRGNILGADISIRDEYERDTGLIRERFGSLHEIIIDKQLLPDYAWRYRVSFTPYDWGTCSR